MRQKIVAGNWKMNGNAIESAALVSEILKLVSTNPVKNQEVILFPPFTNLQYISATLKTAGSKIKTGGQNCHWEEKGAYTGEISASMLKSTGADYVLIGHSERRQYFKESNELLAQKIKISLANGLIPVYCCGETIIDRKSNNHFNVVRKQLEEGLFHFSSFPLGKAGMSALNGIESGLILAYEPVWAIGTGETATPQQAQEMHEFIRNIIKDKYNSQISSSVSILYGGSCNASNAKGLFAQPDIDGGLIGGASLKAIDFVSIIHSL